MVNPVFIIDTMREMDYRYFVILDTQFNTVYQQFQPVSMEEAIKRFKANFAVQTFAGRNKTPTGRSVTPTAQYTGSPERY